jgi:hypothetical protein
LLGDELEKKLASAQADNVARSVIESQLSRDLDLLFDELLIFTERLDADQMKRDGG